MNISAPFIRRPVATSLLAAAMLLAGILAYRSLPVAPLPRVDFPTIQVSAALPGASPETMASSVATPLERRFGRIAGLTEMTSTSTLGSTSITLQFDLDRNVDAAARDVQAAIAAAGGELPPDLPLRPTYRKVNPADSPILILSLTSDTLPLSEVFDAANTILAQKISQVHGVGQVFVGGGQQPAVRVQYDPEALAGMGVNSADVRSAIGATTVDEAKGTIVGKLQSSTIGANDQLFDAEGLPAARHRRRTSGATAQLGDVASVFDDVENNRVAGLGGRQARGARSSSASRPDANIIETNERVLALLPAARDRRSRPRSRSRSTATARRPSAPRSTTSRRRWSSASLLVVVVVFAFLRSRRATLIPTVAMPLSLVGTFGVMWLLGYSIDNLSLMALTISTGFVVDDAIVVTENIMRAIEEGDQPVPGGARGRQADRLHDRLDHRVAPRGLRARSCSWAGSSGASSASSRVTLSVAVAISALVSLTLTPMMCSRLLRSEAARRRTAGSTACSERVFDAMLAFYERGLRWALRHRVDDAARDRWRPSSSTWRSSSCVPKGLFPQQDNGPAHGGDRGGAGRLVRRDVRACRPR